MENTPITTPESTPSVDKKESKSKKKKAENLGAFIVEPKSEKPIKKAEDTAESFWKKSDKAEATAPVESETEAPLEHLGEAEKQFVERELVQAEVAEAEPDIAPIERFRELIAEEGHDSDEALQTTLAELDELPDNTDDETLSESEAEPESLEASDEPQEFGEEEILLGDPTDAEATPLAPAHPVAGGSGQPPRPPVPPVAAATPGMPRPGGQPPRPAVAPALQAPMPNTHIAPPAPEVRYVANPNRAGDFLVGGIIGYLIGRRRGRIKTEKRLLPVQKKLQKEVADVRSQLLQKEAVIREQAAKKKLPVHSPRSRPERSRPTTVEHEAVKPTPRVELAAPVAAMAVEKPRAEVRASAPEAKALHPTREAREQIGHMLVTAEALPKQARKEAAPKPESSAEKPQVTEKHIATLNRAELLKVSEKIIVDGASLRQIYETKLVGEKGLRRLVQEHLKGGDIKKALRREIVEREIDFERDPFLRDRGHDPAGPTGGGKQATLHELLKNVTVPGQIDEEEVAFLKARSAFEAKVREDEKKRRKVMDAGLISTILVLLILILALVMAHR